MNKKNKNLRIISFLIIIFSISSLLAQTGYRNTRSRGMGIEITPIIGYQFGGVHKAYKGELDIRDAESYGLAIGVDLGRSVGKGVQGEFVWTMHESRLDLKKYIDNTTETIFDLTTHYFQIGGLYGVPQGKIFPFGSLSFGATLFSPQGSQFSDEWFFSATIGLGMKVYLSERIGFRFQGRALMPLYFSGGGLWCGGGGCSVGMGATSLVLQGDVNAGLIIRL